MLNFNVGLLGHVDSGKTTLAKALSTVGSTAAFDKNPQSQERKITLDLGFSSTVVEIPQPQQQQQQKVQLTFVDCPGHASLIRTIIGGAQIVDLMILVIDAQKGIQTQTAECIVIAELLKRKLIIAVNKIDLLKSDNDSALNKLHNKLRKTFEKTIFGSDVPIYNVSAQDGIQMQDLLKGICSEIFLPTRDTDLPLLMYVDHCFSIKGQGAICTGTIIQGKVAIGDTVEIPQIGEQRKVKTIQMFRNSIKEAVMGDRVGLCITPQFNVKLLERGVIAQPGYLKPIFAVCIRLERISYYKYAIKHKSKYHITVGHETVMGSITLFYNKSEEEKLDLEREFEFLEELTPDSRHEIPIVYALIEFETGIISAPNAKIIASKLDMDVHSNSCRLAFWGEIQWSTNSNQYLTQLLPKFKIFKKKIKQGSIQRLINDNEIIVQDLFKKETDPDLFIGKTVELSTGEIGTIESKFGKVSKIKVYIKESLKPETLEKLKTGKLSGISVVLKYKKYIFNKSRGLCQ